jgi:hypothetical protein
MLVGIHDRAQTLNEHTPVLGVARVHAVIPDLPLLTACDYHVQRLVACAIEAEDPGVLACEVADFDSSTYLRACS